MTSAHPAAAAIDATRARLSEALDPLVPAGAEVALVDFPHHSNVGDSAIWVGEQAHLGRRGVRVAYRCTWRTYDAATMRRRLGRDGVVLVHGGGNFGDLYRRHQQLRERVLADSAGRLVVQLPQTVNFSTPAALEAFTRAHGTRDDLVLLVRDTESRDLLAGSLARPPVLAPDMVFALGPRQRTVPAEQDVLALLRTDHESAGLLDQAAALGLDAVDWLDHRRDGDGSVADRALDLAGRGDRRLTERTGRALAAVAGAGLDRRAVREVARGEALLSRGRVVVTDRLHAHLLSYLMGIPHVVLADRHAKVTRASRLWVGEHPWIRTASTVEEAVVLAQELLAGPLSAEGAAGG